MIAHDDVDDHGDAAHRPVAGATFRRDAQDGCRRRSRRMVRPVARRCSSAPAGLAPTDDDAIIRDNRPLGYPTLSLLVCIASVGPEGVDLAYGAFDEPGRWNALEPGLNGHTARARGVGR